MIQEMYLLLVIQVWRHLAVDVSYEKRISSLRSDFRVMSNVVLLFGACVAALQLVFVEIKELEERDGRHQHSFLSCILSKDGAAVIWSISFCNPSRKIFEAS